MPLTNEQFDTLTDHAFRIAWDLTAKYDEPTRLSLGFLLLMILMEEISNGKQDTFNQLLEAAMHKMQQYRYGTLMEYIRKKEPTTN